MGRGRPPKEPWGLAWLVGTLEPRTCHCFFLEVVACLVQLVSLQNSHLSARP